MALELKKCFCVLADDGFLHDIVPRIIWLCRMPFGQKKRERKRGRKKRKRDRERDREEESKIGREKEKERE